MTYARSAMSCSVANAVHETTIKAIAPSLAHVLERASLPESFCHRCCFSLLTAQSLGCNLGLDGDRFDILRGDDKREVRERLREVANLTAKIVVILLREKTQVIA